tara:strand:+ start:263 stop:454 length:192 start_codon:yes stop_codon:yes gene_type:complete
MKGRKEIYKSLERKNIFLITKSNFKYHTSDLKVLDDCVVFTDNRGQKIILDLNEISFCQEVGK